MKKIIVLFALAILNCSLIIDNCLCQWQPDVRLNIDPSASWTSENNAWCVAASGNEVHVVWMDNRDGNAEIYYKRSTDGGTSWGADTRLTNNSAGSAYPSVTVSGLVVNVVWEDNRDGNDEIYYKRSTDGGTSWGADTRLTNNSAASERPSVTVSGSVVHVAWRDLRDGNEEIYYKRSTDGGISWGADTQLTSNSAISQYPSVSVFGSVVHVVWRDDRDGNYEIYYKRSTDGGLSWGADTRLTNNSAASGLPSVSVSGSVVHIVWYDNRDENWEIYYIRSTDGGTSWGADTRLTNNTSVSLSPSVTVSGSVVHVVWDDGRDGSHPEIYYKRSTDGGTSWGADFRLTNNPANSFSPFVSVSGSVVHVVWRDERDGNFEIYYKRDPTGNPVGIINYNSEIPGEFSLSQNYPNPFNPNTIINFQLSRFNFVSIKVYHVLGNEVSTLVNEKLNAGSYSISFNGSNLSSGIYFYKLTAGDFSITRKMTLLK